MALLGHITQKKRGDASSFREDGRYVEHKEPDSDLFFASEKHKGWITLYGDRNMNLYATNPFKSEETAINFDKIQDIYTKTIKIEWEE